MPEGDDATSPSFDRLGLRYLLRRDLGRYRRGRWFLYRGAWVSVVLRCGQVVVQHSSAPRLVRRVLGSVVVPALLARLGVDIGINARIGPGLLMPHPMSVVIHGSAELGANCVILQGVTIGNRRPGGGVPKLGENVEVGAYAQILGPVSVGSGAKVGALALVLTDVPQGGVMIAPAACLRADPHVDEGR